MKNISATLKGICVDWLGMSNGYTDEETGKKSEPKPIVKFITRDNQGRPEVVTAKRRDDQNFKIGEVVDVDVSISTFNNQLYFAVEKVFPSPSKAK
jgi:hypothetical protein